LKWRKRRNAAPVPYWFASRKALKQGYPLKSANLAEHAHDPIMLLQRCDRLELEQRLWLDGAPRVKPSYNGTFGSLLKVYETDPESTFQDLKPAVRKSYLVYIKRLGGQLADVRIDDSDGTDVKRWFRGWRVGDDGKDRLPRACFVLAVLKAALSFGVVRRLAGVAAFKAAADELEFPRPKRRTHAPTAAQIIAARQAAHAAGAPLRALLYALQFETTLRQTDITGMWLPLSEPQPSTIHDGRTKWIGPLWSAIDANGIIKIKPTKTEDTTGVEVTFDLTVCPMVQEDLARIPLASRVGPLIVDHATGLPYRYQTLNNDWHRDFEAAGLPATLWNRDLRAGGVTEGGKAGAGKDDRRKLAGHAREETTEVYDRDMLEAHRRVMGARAGYRQKNETKTD
jgi:hypothetical protein